MLLCGAILVVLAGIILLIIPYHLTPMMAVHAWLPGDWKILLSEELANGKVLLIERSDGAQEVIIERKVGPLWQCRVASGVEPPVRTALTSTVAIAQSVNTPEAVVAFAGMNTDEHVDRISAGGQVRSLQGQQFYLFVWVTTDREIYTDAKAFDADGQLRYEFDNRNKRWRSVQ